MKTISTSMTSFRALSALLAFVLLVLVGLPAQAQLHHIDGEWAFSDTALVPSSATSSLNSNSNEIDFFDEWENTSVLRSLDPQEWKRFGEAIEDGLVSPNASVQQAALRLVIAYGEHLDFSSAAVVDVIHLYREGTTEAVRRMAVVSLSKMKSTLAMGFLERSSAFEASESVKTTIDAVLAEVKS